MLTEEERLDTLALLKRSKLSFLFISKSDFLAHGELLSDLSCFPLRFDSLSMKQKKQALDQRIIDVESAVEVFSKKLVYIQKDDDDYESNAE